MLPEITSAAQSNSAPMKPGTLSAVILLFFFISGACGLMYQIVWMRVMGLVFGNTTYATSAVISGYMAGLGLGALYFGKWIDRQTAANPIRLYGLMEGGVGLYALFTPLLWKLIDVINIGFYQTFNPSFLNFSLFKFLVSFIFLFIPTFLMGGTLPILSKFYVTHKDLVAYKVGILYALNTAGAVTGVLFSSFFCLYYLGVWETTILTAILNFAIFFICWFWIKGSNEVIGPTLSNTATNTVKDVPRSSYLKILLMLFAVSGGVSMMYEIGWTRVLAIVLGSSIYAFAVMLSTFLLGIALGSFLFSWVVKKMKVDLSIFAILQILTAFFGFVGLNQFEEMPFRFIQLYQWSKNTPQLIEAGRFGLCALVMLGPTVCIGAMFACFIHLYHQQENLGDDIGTAYFANTIGTIFGAALTGFVIIPAFGIFKTLMAASCINVIIGLAAFIMALPRKQLDRSIAFAMVILFAGTGAVQARPWNRSIVTSGAAVRPSMHAARSKQDFIRSLQNRVNLYYKEGASATVSVNQVRDIISLAVNGKTDASNGTDSFNQFLLGHLPMLLNSNAKKVLTIGLGSGSTLAAVASYAVHQIDCVELESAVIDGAKYFHELNRNVLNDPRVKMIINDGRNYLKINPTKYDVIISEPSNPWMAGVANLFSLEHYRTMKARLNPQGVVCQWLHAYSMSDQDLRMIMKTFTLSFPHTSLWTSNYPDLILIGSNEPIKIDYIALKQGFDQPKVLRDFEPFGVDTVDGLLGTFWLTDQELRNLSANARTNSDNHPFLEFSAPKHLYEDTVSSNYYLINAFANQKYPVILNLEPPVESNSQFHIRVAQSNFYRKIFGKVQPEIDLARSLDPDNALLFQISGLLKHQMNNGDGAEADLRRSLAMNPNLAESHYYLGLIQLQQGKINDAVFSFQRAVDINPKTSKYFVSLADALSNIQAYDFALAALDQAISLSPLKFELLVRKVTVLGGMANTDEQINFLEGLIGQYPKHISFYEMLGQLYQETGKPDKAERIYRSMIKQFPLDASGYLQLGILYGKSGNMSMAKEQLKKAMKYNEELSKNLEIQKVLQYKGA